MALGTILFFDSLPLDPVTNNDVLAIMEMKWFNLPGAKEGFIRDIKLGLVHDPSQEIPWNTFYARSGTDWEIFAPTFPDQAWTLHQIFLIDKNIDETLNSLERWVPSSCKPKSWTEAKKTEGDFEYYQDTAAMIRQRELRPGVEI